MASFQSDDNHIPERVVGTFLDYLKIFQYDKAKDLVDKDKEYCKSNPQDIPSIWPMILSSLSQLAIAEKSYSSFLYLSPKWFGRKDAKGVYDAVAIECKKIEEQGARTASKFSSLAYLCGGLIPYVQVKSLMIDFFSSLHAMTSIKFCDRSDLLLKLSDILSKCHDPSYHLHQQLEPLIANFITECEVIESLLQADIAMSKWCYPESLLHLQNAHTKISHILSVVSPQATKTSTLIKIGFLGMKTASNPELHVWLKKYKDAIYSKFTFYFYDVLSKYSPQGDMKLYLNRCSIDYCTSLITFHKKTGASLVTLILNSEDLTIKGPGYSNISIPSQTLQGRESYIAIFCYPSSRVETGELSNLPCLPSCHQASLVMLMSYNERQLNQSEKPVVSYDEKSNVMYVVSRIDPAVSLVVIYESKKSDRDKKSILSYLHDISSSLRYTKLFSDLRPS